MEGCPHGAKPNSVPRAVTTETVSSLFSQCSKAFTLSIDCNNRNAYLLNGYLCQEEFTMEKTLEKAHAVDETQPQNVPRMRTNEQDEEELERDPGVPENCYSLPKALHALGSLLIPPNALTYVK